MPVGFVLVRFAISNRIMGLQQKDESCAEVANGSHAMCA